MVWHGRVRTGFGQGSARPRWLGLLTVTPHSTKWDAMPVKTNCVDCKIPRAWMDRTGDADESDPNNCVSVSLQSYRIAATIRWSFFRMPQGVSWSDFRHNFLQLAMPSTLTPKYWHFIFSDSNLNRLNPYWKKFPRRWTFRFLFKQRVSVFLFLANLLLWHVNCARSYGTRVAFCFWEYSYTSRCVGILSADFLRIFAISSRWEVDFCFHMFYFCVSAIFVDLNYRYRYL